MKKNCRRQIKKNRNVIKKKEEKSCMSNGKDIIIHLIVR